MNIPAYVSPIKYLLLLLLLLAGSLLKAQESFSITGKVRDDAGLLPGATVFLTGTRVITACDNEGNFHLDKILPGQYVLVVKMIGFEPQSAAVVINNHSQQLNFVLKTNTNKLNEVVIKADNNWAAHYAEFKEQFLGSTPNARECKIVNPKVLYFHFDKATQTLSATAGEFLVIENNALGYRIKYLLNNFEHDNTNRILRYQGYPSFDEMTPKDDKQAAAWNKNRKTAYLGSITHLMRAIYQAKPYSAGFEIFKVLNKPPPGVKPDNDQSALVDQHPILIDSLLTTTDKNFKMFTFKDALFILYTKTMEPYSFTKSIYHIERPQDVHLPLGQISIAHLMDGPVTIDAQGNFSPTSSLLFEGFMAWRQIADLTPLEFGKDE
jgi:hypothetical protein